MLTGRRREAWSHTAEVLALVYNSHRDPKHSKPATGATFNPFRQPVRKKISFYELAKSIEASYNSGTLKDGKKRPN